MLNRALDRLNKGLSDDLLADDDTQDFMLWTWLYANEI